MKPVLLVIAGPNGSGKTTITARLREDHWSEGIEYLNPDEVAQDRFGDWSSPEAMLDAARWVEFVRRAKQAGCFTRVFFIGTADPRINASRVAGRIIEGGHPVPIEKIVSRYVRSMANLSAGIVLADRTYIYDNSVEDVEARLCARTQNGKLRKIYGELPLWITAAVEDVPRHAEFEDLRAA